MERLVKFCIGCVVVVVVGCTEEERPDDSFFLSKEWKMIRVLVNGTVNDIDKSAYRLSMQEDFTFRRVNFDGSVQEGVWSLDNGGNQLVLFSDTPTPERYLIVDLQFRRMELQVILASNKTGSTEYRYILEPTRP